MRIADNGCGLDHAKTDQTPNSGLGLRNMQERIEQLDGVLRVTSSTSGTVIEANVPLSHLLQPQGRLDPIPDAVPPPDPKTKASA